MAIRKCHALVDDLHFTDHIFVLPWPILLWDSELPSFYELPSPLVPNSGHHWNFHGTITSLMHTGQGLSWLIAGRPYRHEISPHDRTSMRLFVSLALILPSFLALHTHLLACSCSHLYYLRFGQLCILLLTLPPFEILLRLDKSSVLQNYPRPPTSDYSPAIITCRLSSHF